MTGVHVRHSPQGPRLNPWQQKSRQQAGPQHTGRLVPHLPPLHWPKPLRGQPRLKGSRETPTLGGGAVSTVAMLEWTTGRADMNKNPYNSKAHLTASVQAAGQLCPSLATSISSHHPVFITFTGLGVSSPSQLFSPLLSLEGLSLCTGLPQPPASVRGRRGGTFSRLGLLRSSPHDG